MIFLHDVKKSIRQKKLFWSIKQEKWHNTRIPRSNFIVHKNHIWNLSEIHECFWCVLSDVKMRKWLSTRVTFKISLIYMNGFHQITSLSKWFSTRATNEIFLIFVNGFYSPSNCICYIEIFTKGTNISNVTHVENHWHQLVIWENTSKSFT